MRRHVSGNPHLQRFEYHQINCKLLLFNNDLHYRIHLLMLGARPTLIILCIFCVQIPTEEARGCFRKKIKSVIQSLLNKKKTILDHTPEREFIDKLDKRFYQLYNPFGEFAHYSATPETRLFGAGLSGIELISLENTTINRLKLFSQALTYLHIMKTISDDVSQNKIPELAYNEIPESHTIDLELLTELIKKRLDGLRFILKPITDTEIQVLNMLMDSTSSSKIKKTAALTPFTSIPIEQAIVIAMKGFDIKDSRDSDTLRFYLEHWDRADVSMVKKDLEPLIPLNKQHSIIYFVYEVMEAYRAAEKYREDYLAYIKNPIRGMPTEPVRQDFRFLLQPNE